MGVWVWVSSDEEEDATETEEKKSSSEEDGGRGFKLASAVTTGVVGSVFLESDGGNMIPTTESYPVPKFPQI